MTTLYGVRVVDPASGSVSEPMDVDFEQQIRSIAPSGQTSERERFLVPGLIDTHVHLGSRDALQRAVASGITTVVDLGTHPDELVTTQRGWDDVPAILSAGSAASAPGSSQISLMGFPAESGVTGPDDAERYLDWRQQGGSDLVKIIIEDPAATQVPALSPETLEALVTGAHRRGLLTVAHVVTADAFERGLDAGVDVLTHTPLDRPLPESTALRMAEQGVVASPTLVMMRAMARARLGERAEAAFGVALESVRQLHASGVTVVAGTDANEIPMAPVAHGPSLHEELGLLRQAGLGADEVLRAATSTAAASMRLVDRGNVAAGKRADLLLVDTDPREDVGALAHPQAVWVAGRQLAGQQVTR